jgi:hypothetical protein
MDNGRWTTDNEIYEARLTISTFAKVSVDEGRIPPMVNLWLTREDFLPRSSFGGHKAI